MISETKHIHVHIHVHIHAVLHMHIHAVNNVSRTNVHLERYCFVRLCSEEQVLPLPVWWLHSLLVGRHEAMPRTNAITYLGIVNLFGQKRERKERARGRERGERKKERARGRGRGEEGGWGGGRREQEGEGGGVWTYWKSIHLCQTTSAMYGLLTAYDI